MLDHDAEGNVIGIEVLDVREGLANSEAKRPERSTQGLHSGNGNRSRYDIYSGSTSIASVASTRTTAL